VPKSHVADDGVVESLLRLPHVERASGKSKAAIYAAMSRGEFPRPVRIGRKSVAWRASEIRDWQATLPRADAVE